MTRSADLRAFRRHLSGFALSCRDLAGDRRRWSRLERAAAAQDATLFFLALLGVDNVACVKPVLVRGEKRSAIHAANGEELVIFEQRAIADETLRQPNSIR